MMKESVLVLGRMAGIKVGQAPLRTPHHTTEGGGGGGGGAHIPVIYQSITRCLLPHSHFICCKATHRCKVVNMINRLLAAVLSDLGSRASARTFTNHTEVHKTFYFANCRYISHALSITHLYLGKFEKL